MGRGIHRRNTEDGPRYRLWSTASDSYCTRELTYDALVDVLRDDAEREFARELAGRIARVNEHGSSFFDEPRDMDGPWDTELCGGCGGFHHEYEQSKIGDGCSQCGEAEDDRAHATPCVAVGGA